MQGGRATTAGRDCWAEQTTTAGRKQHGGWAQAARRLGANSTAAGCREAGRRRGGRVDDDEEAGRRR